MPHTSHLLGLNMSYQIILHFISLSLSIPYYFAPEQCSIKCSCRCCKKHILKGHWWLPKLLHCIFLDSLLCIHVNNKLFWRNIIFQNLWNTFVFHEALGESSYWVRRVRNCNCSDPNRKKFSLIYHKQPLGVVEMSLSFFVITLLTSSPIYSLANPGCKECVFFDPCF